MSVINLKGKLLNRSNFLEWLVHCMDNVEPSSALGMTLDKATQPNEEIKSALSNVALSKSEETAKAVETIYTTANSRMVARELEKATASQSYMDHDMRTTLQATTVSVAETETSQSDFDHDLATFREMQDEYASNLTYSQVRTIGKAVEFEHRNEFISSAGQIKFFKLAKIIGTKAANTMAMCYSCSSDLSFLNGDGEIKIPMELGLQTGTVYPGMFTWDSMYNEYKRLERAQHQIRTQSTAARIRVKEFGSVPRRM